MKFTKWLFYFTKITFFHSLATINQINKASIIIKKCIFYTQNRKNLREITFLVLDIAFLMN